MAGFRKKVAQAAPLKMTLYGAPGSGKTLTSLLFAEGLARLTGKRVAFVDTERGSDHYARTIPEREVHPDAFDFDALDTRSISETLAALKTLSPAAHAVVVIDSITHLWQSVLNAAGDNVPINKWTAAKKPNTDLMHWVVNSPYHVILCGREGTKVEQGDDPDVTTIARKMQAEKNTQYEPDFSAHMSHLLRKGKLGKGVESDVMAFFEKDRTGILSGRTFVNPTFDTVIKPLLPYIGDAEGRIAGEDETAVRDTESIAESERERGERSAEMLRQFCAEFDLAGSVEAVKAVSAKLTPDAKKLMKSADVDALRAKYHEAEARVGGGKRGAA